MVKLAFSQHTWFRFRPPGAMPQATMNLAFGQANLVRYIKTVQLQNWRFRLMFADDSLRNVSLMRTAHDAPTR
jgi:hypothetical protein